MMASSFLPKAFETVVGLQAVTALTFWIAWQDLRKLRQFSR
jgi:hypothetical protein